MAILVIDQRLQRCIGKGDVGCCAFASDVETLCHERVVDGDGGEIDAHGDPDD